MSRSKVTNIKSGSGEYLAFVASTSEQGIEIHCEDKNIWLSESDCKSYSVQHYNICVKSQFEQYRINQDRVFESNFDREFMKLVREEEYE